MVRLRSVLVASLLALSVACASARSSSDTVAGPPASGAARGTAAPLPGAGAPAQLPSDIPFVSLEGPLWISAGGYLVFSDVVEANGEGAHIYRYDPGPRRFSVLPYPSESPVSTNGMAVDPTGNRLIVCERYNGRVVRIDPGTRLMVLADHAPTGEALAAPNDLAVRADGNIYFSDSDWGVNTAVAHGKMGFNRIAPTGTIYRVLDVDKPNGVALSPDGTSLYLGSDVQAKVWRLPLDSGGAAGAPTLLIDGAMVPGGFRVPDGICVDDSGNLYVANNDDALRAIVVFDPTGRELGRITLPNKPSNCTFGGPDRRTMYVTTLHTIYEVRMPIPGLP